MGATEQGAQKKTEKTKKIKKTKHVRGMWGGLKEEQLKKWIRCKCQGEIEDDGQGPFLRMEKNINTLGRLRGQTK